MITSVRRASAALVCSLAIAWLFLPAPSGADAAVPYVDPAAVGRIGLCDQSGKAITGGGIDDKPFVWRAVSSVPAPLPYQGAAEKATLLAYQPRPNVSADNWSGDTLTASSTYSNRLVPVAAATPVDFTLRDFINEFKPMQDGLIQLRMYFGIPGLDTYSDTYPTTDIRVDGQQWTVVSPAQVACSAGSSESTEVGLVAGASTVSPGSGTATTHAATAASPSRVSTAATSTAPSVTSGASGGPKGTAKPGGSTSSVPATASHSNARTSSLPQPTAGDGSTAISGSAKSVDAHGGRSSSTGPVLLATGLGLLGVGVLAVQWYRRRLRARSHGI